MVSFRILGPIELYCEERRVALGGPRQLGLLAFLLVHANRAVSTDRLIDALWAQDDAGGGVKRAQVAIGRLRRVLEGEGGLSGERRLRTVVGGYLLEVRTGELDADVFRWRVEHGRRALDAGEPGRAASLLRDALALWRGAPLAEVTFESFAQTDIALLDELRLSALEARVEADLQLGRQAELVGELQSLVTAHPTREQLAAQLMLALYRVGRQAEALAAYRQARERLIGDLGLEPSPALRDLERAILAHDPALRPSAPAAARSAPRPVGPGAAPSPIGVPPPGPVIPESDAPRDQRAAVHDGMVETRKTVTIVCCDVVRSTSPGERLDPEVVRGVMSRCSAAMRSVLERHGGSVEEFIGEAVMAVFGVPVAHEDDALRAVRATTEIRAGLAALNDELVHEHGVTVAARSGVTTGEVLVGGDRAGGASLAAGEAVNVAARLQQSAAPGEILIGEGTYRLVGHAVRAESLVPAALEGDSGRAGVWRLGDLLATAPVAVPASPFVGRQHELAALRDAFDRAVVEQRCRLVTVIAPAGTGKSRLAGELVAAVGARARALRGRCLSYGEGITYWPLAEIVSQIGGSEPGQLMALLQPDPQAEFLAQRIAGAVGLSSIETRTEEVLWAVRRLLEALARERPLVVVFDDIHWAEPTFLDLVEYLAAFAAAPILLLCLARPELLALRPSWAAADAAVIALQPLSEREAQRLLGQLASLPPSVVRDVLDRAEGNPLFVEQLLALVRDEAVGQPIIPPTLQALLAARMDQLSDGERAVAECAAAEGRLFHRRAVSALAPPALQDEVPAHLLALARKQFIRPAEAVFAHDDGFRFAHVLLRETAYHATPKTRRAALHERFAEWLERTVEEPAVAYEEILGYHLEQACRYRSELGIADAHGAALAERAAERLGSAGRRALSRGDARAAASLLQRAASLLPADSLTRIGISLELGSARGIGGDLAGAEAAFREVIERAGAAGDRRSEQRAILERELLLISTDPEGSLERLPRLVQPAMSAFHEAEDDLGLAMSHLVLGRVAWMQCRFGDATAAFELALRYAERAGDQRVMLEIIMWLTAGLSFGPVPVDEALRRCQTILKPLDDNPLAQAKAAAGVAVLEALRGRFDRAREICATQQALLADLALTFDEAIVQLFSGRVEMYAGNHAGAESAVRGACDIFAAMGDRGYRSSAAALLADVLHAQGKDDEAERFTEVSEQLASSDDIDAQTLWRAVRGKVLAGRGRTAAALTLAREAVALAQTTDSYELHADALSDLAAVLRLGGQPREAADVLRAALDRYERKGARIMVDRTRELLNDVDKELSLSPR